MSEYNEINPGLEEELNSVLNKYIEDEYKYQELCVEIVEKTIVGEEEADRLLESFKDFGANDLEAKIKLAEFMLAGF